MQIHSKQDHLVLQPEHQRSTPKPVSFSCRELFYVVFCQRCSKMRRALRCSRRGPSKPRCYLSFTPQILTWIIIRAKDYRGLEFCIIRLPNLLKSKHVHETVRFSNQQDLSLMGNHRVVPSCAYFFFVSWY